MRLHELTPFPEERKGRKRIGRGSASGSGCTAGKGNKGQRSRSGGHVRPGFEGGQMPLQRRLPKHGFKNPFRTEYAPVNVAQLAATFAGKNEISLEDIYASGLARRGSLVKVLGQGDLTAAFRVEAHRFSASAAEKIRVAGGEITALGGIPEQQEG